MPKSGTGRFRKWGKGTMSSSGNPSLLSTRLQRMMVYGLVIFRVVPLALGLLLFTQVGGATVRFLPTYYVIALLGLAGIMFEPLVNQSPRPTSSARHPS